MQNRKKQFQLKYNDIKISNLESAIISQNTLILTPSFDPINPLYSLKQSSKTFFHFSIKASEPTSIMMIIKNMKILQYFTNSQQFDEYYRICVGHKKKRGWEHIVQYEKVQLQQMKRIEVDSNYQLHFNFNIKQQQTYLAYHYPYSFQKSQNYLRTIKQQINHINQIDNKVYYFDQLLIESLERRPVHFLTLTANNKIINEDQARVSKSLFPFFQIEGRPKKFNKPYIFFTCRVHPGQTSSSYALEGILDFLLSNSKKSNLLLENFVFIIVPVLNPDGVYHGTYRMDTLGHNLNRFYNNALSHKQPAIFAVHTLVNYYSNRIIFFMDLHSHPHPNKGSFIYGNCLPQIQQHLQSQLYAKLLSFQSQCFGYNWCNFSNNQMNSKDINEILTKDGCARVQIYKLLNIPFSYTMQIGYHGCPLKIKQRSSYYDTAFKRSTKIFGIEDYLQHGKSIILTIFNIFVFNTSLGIKNKHGKYWQQQRQQIFKQLIQKQERFRYSDNLVFKKAKIINEINLQKIYHPIFKKYPTLQPDLNKYLSPQRSSFPHSLSYQSKDESKQVLILAKKQFSLQIKNVSKTIQPSHYTHQQDIKAFKSTLNTNQRSNSHHHIDSFVSYKDYKFAKMLNLDFNPFPSTPRKKICSFMGLKKIDKHQYSQMQREVQSPLKEQNKKLYIHLHEKQKKEAYNNEFQSPERLNKKILQYESIVTIKPNSSVNKNNHSQQQEMAIKDEGYEYQDINYEQYQKRLYEQKFLLPKIHRNEKNKELFNTQIQLLKQMDKKYLGRDLKDRNLYHNKVPLRSNGLKMKCLIKSIK